MAYLKKIEKIKTKKKLKTKQLLGRFQNLKWGEGGILKQNPRFEFYLDLLIWEKWTFLGKRYSENVRVY